MNSYFKNSIFKSLILTFTFLFSVAATASEKISNSCEFLPEHLYSCDKFKCETIIKEGENNNIVKQEIKGVDKEGLCVHEQTTINNEHIICHYEKESRKFMSIKMQDAKNGSIGKNEEDIEYSEALIGEIFYNECEVFDNAGNKMNFSEENQEIENVDFQSMGRKLTPEEMVIEKQKPSE